MTESPLRSTAQPSSTIGVGIGVQRSQIIAIAVVGIILGVIGLVFPRATLLTVAIIFGIYLIASGIFRITVALVAQGAPTGLRWLTGILGLAVVAAGVLCLSNPFQSLVVLAFVIGIGWIAEGIIDLVSGSRSTSVPRWLGIASGIVSIVSGVIMFVLPALALSAFVSVGAILLLIVSVTTLLTLPRGARA